jgi:PHD/YefM family antitoxin component YafN of YafNO toxin-antitoxin module
MLTLSISDVRYRIHVAVNKVAFCSERAKIVRHGKPVAAIVSLEDLVVLESIDTNLREGLLKVARRRMIHG